MILCVGTTPAAQRVMIFPRLGIDQVNRARSTLDGAAGKSINVAKVLNALGARPLAVGLAGGPRGEQLLGVLRERGVAVEFVTVSTPTRQCVTVIDEATASVTELVEESAPVDSSAWASLWATIQARVPQAQAVVLSGTIAPGCPRDSYQQCTRLAHQHQVLSVVDASGSALMEALKARPGLVKPNRAELEATVGHPLASDEELIAAMKALAGQGAARVVVTGGADATLAFDGTHLWRVSVPRVKALNPIGSGDAFTAALTWRLVLGEDLGSACRWASATGAANTLTPMAGEVNRADVDRLLPQVEVDQL